LKGKEVKIDSNAYPKLGKRSAYPVISVSRQALPVERGCPDRATSHSRIISYPILHQEKLVKSIIRREDND
jgi:hypothetical protein